MFFFRTKSRGPLLRDRWTLLFVDDDLQGFDVFESQLFDPPKIMLQLDSYLKETMTPYKEYLNLDVLEFLKTN